MNPQKFFDTIHEKFLRMIEEKGRSRHPWDDFSFNTLRDRLEEEYVEYQNSLKGYSHEAIQDELVDIACCSMFLWLKWESIKDGIR